MSKRPLRRRRFLVLAALAAIVGPACVHAQTVAERKPNVLFIAVDDLRPTLGCYGNTLVQSPNIDRLAARGVVFTRAYCQQAVCAPSRNSLLTGRRPDTIGIYDLATNFRTKLPDVVTLPQHFKQNGYHTESMGKIYHTGHGNYDDARSWSVPSWPPRRGGPPPPQKAEARLGGGFQLAASVQEAPAPAQTPPMPRRSNAPRKNGPPTGAPDVPDNGLFDGKLADHAVERLGALAKDKEKPFFLAVGFQKPHLPFIAPKRYWDRYDPARFALEPVKELPQGAPPYVGNGAGELRTYAGVPQKGPIPEEQARLLLHGYHASVSYMDAQVGRIVDALDRLGLRENTVIILWGDHGWHLGDHGLWAKHTNFERAARAPLIVSAPGKKAVGQRCDALTEFVDIYPSLCELAGLPKSEGLEGTSFAPLLDDPKRPWKTAAFHQWPRRVGGQIRGMGRSIRTDRYRLTEWTVEGSPEDTAVELYDYLKDPRETVNLAVRPENAKLVAEMKARLHAGWRKELP